MGSALSANLSQTHHSPENAFSSNVPSWCSDTSPMVLSNIFREDMSVSIWKREPNKTISNYFEQVFDGLGIGVRQVFSMSSLREGLTELLPEGEGRTQTIDDIYLLADMLTCLFNCDSVGLRLAPLSKAMCPKFHTDNIPVRLVNTFLGSGTEWLPREVLCTERMGPKSDGIESNAMGKTRSGLYYAKRDIHQLDAFHVGLLKGSAWEEQENMAALHRSCDVDVNLKRVLLTLDPM